MQTLTIPAAVTKRKQACRSCRQKKKKCDAIRPRCSLCKKADIACEYGVPAATTDFDDKPCSIYPEPHASGQFVSRSAPLLDQPNFMQFPGLNFSTPFFNVHYDDTDHNNYLTPESSNDYSLNGESSNQQDLLKDFELPSPDVLNELSDLFFENLYHMFPCFHRRNFQQRVQNGDMQRESPLLLYAMCCVTARYHPDKDIQGRGKEWFEQAKFYYDVTRRNPYPALRTMQAVLLLILHAWTSGDYSSSWLFVGKAWRQAVAVGMNRMDSNETISAGQLQQGSYCTLSRAGGQTAVEKEECRRTLWTLFILDREHAWPTGWPTAISEKHFKLDLPIADESFQSLDPNAMDGPYKNIPFIRSLKHLISSSSSAQESLNVFRYIVIANVLLGRVLELVYSLHDTPGSPEYEEECKELDSHLLKLRLSIPRQASSVLDAPAADRAHVIWLQITMNCIAMLLYYRETNQSSSPGSESITFAITAAHNVAQIIKDASRISIDLLLSAHLGASMYIAACILIIEWRLSGDAKLKDEIDLFELVFDRMNDVFVFLGLKFKFALQHDLKRSEVSVNEMRAQGFKGLLANCSTWKHVQEEVHKRGIQIDIT